MDFSNLIFIGRESYLIDEAREETMRILRRARKRRRRQNNTVIIV